MTVPKIPSAWCERTFKLLPLMDFSIRFEAPLRSLFVGISTMDDDSKGPVIRSEGLSHQLQGSEQPATAS
jgi:hypothetical protein